jgi:hypothetical protein
VALIYVTNWSSPSLKGKGNQYSIMRFPRTWEYGDGLLEVLRPLTADILAVKAGTIDHNQYRKAFIQGIKLQKESLNLIDLRDGDTLLCSCSKAKAKENKCHRVWAACLLCLKGYEVCLDGNVLIESEARSLLIRPIL